MPLPGRGEGRRRVKYRDAARAQPTAGIQRRFIGSALATAVEYQQVEQSSYVVAPEAGCSISAFACGWSTQRARNWACMNAVSRAR